MLASTKGKVASQETFLKRHCARNDGKAGHGRVNEARLGVRMRTMRPVALHVDGVPS